MVNATPRMYWKLVSIQLNRWPYSHRKPNPATSLAGFAINQSKNRAAEGRPVFWFVRFDYLFQSNLCSRFF
jgi:hypothetical protein